MSKIDLPAERRVGHLRLLREARSITPKEFNSLTSAERLDIIRRAHGMQKYNLLIEASDSEALVRRMAAQEVYLLIKELGVEDSADLVPMATTGQFTTFIDLDCWDGDVMNGDKALEWIGLLLDGGEEKVFDTLYRLDFELLSLMFKKFITVVGGPEDIEEEDLRTQAMCRDGGYSIEYRDPEQEAKLVGGFLELIFRNDGDFFRRIMDSVRWESEAILEEDVYRFRAGRLEQLGFPDPFEALKVYGYLDVELVMLDEHRKNGAFSGYGVAAPGFYLTRALPGDILSDVLSAGIHEETSWELTYLINKVMIASRIDIGDVLAVQGETEEVYRYLNIGLEYLSEGDVEKAIRLFDEIYLESLFRIGYSLTVDLQRRGKVLEKSPIGPYLDGPFRALIHALGRRKPRFYEGINEQNRGGERPFATLHDVRLASEWLDRLEVQRRLFSERFGFSLPHPELLKLDGCYPESAEDLALSDFFLTALANRIAGRDFLPEPIPREELASLHGRVCTDGKLSADLRRETVQWLESLEAGAGAFGDYCLDLWSEEFCGLELEELEPRYISGLLVRVG